MSPRYRHTQTGWVMIVSAVIVLLVSASSLAGAGYAHGWVLVGAIVALLLAGFGVMTITVDDRSIQARLGVGVIRKRVELSEVRWFRCVNNPWYYGWGIRLFPGGTLYNVSGFRAVELMLKSGKRLRFGSDEPEALVRAIEAVKGQP